MESVGINGMQNVIKNPKGVSLIAAVFIIVILAFMGLMFLSMISTGSMTAVNDAQSVQALYVAQGGLERAKIQFAGGATCADLSLLNMNVLLGPGNFTTTGVLYNPPTATLTAVINTTTTVIPVTNAAGYAPQGRITIDSEAIWYGGISGNSFINAQRGVGGTTPAAHNVGATVTQNACVVTSVGVVGNARRTVEGNVASRSGAMMVYAKLNGDGIPYYRRWDGTSWGAEMTATPVPANIQYIILKFARTRNEAVLGTLSSNGDIRVQVWNGAGWGATTLMGNTSAANSIYRGFDIEYETGTDRAIVVYNNDVPNQVSYRIWSGLVWAAPATQNLASGSIGDVRWIELARNPLNASNEIAMIVLGSTNVYVYGLRWTGAGWNNMGVPAAWDTAASTSTAKAIHVAYEQQTGRAVFIWGRSSGAGVGNGHQYYRVWNGATLNGPTDLYIAAMGGVANWIRLAADPFSNGIMYSVQDSGRDLNTRYWNGVAWDTAAAHPEHDAGTEDTSRNNDVVFETAAANAGRAWLLWGNGSRLSRRQWNGAAWGGIATTGDDTSFVQLVAHPVSGAVLSGIYESTFSSTANRDIWESHLTQGSAIWSPRVVIWGGRTVAAPVMERLSLAVEQYNPPIVQGWREIVN